ncbi:transcriptional regulator CynR [Nocardia crassostreae]|uniref:transcriptional regulator CynR n=1 Tax=Nocardia crassostreae TaxID=53428 RepID=UPI00082B487E|nr:transcriptional regulator CynR [Nocardia crassostreae]
MDPELRHVRYLLAVAEQGNFTRAAHDLHISQPTLSQQIKQLEKALGAQLLDRSGRTVRLTDAGAAYTRYAARAIRELRAAERAVHDVADLSRGSVRLVLTPTFTAYLVGPLTAELRRRHPRLDLETTETTQDRIETGLLADEFDLGIAFDRSHLPGIDATGLCTETLSLVAGAQSEHDRAAALPVRDLAGLELALLSADFATRSHIDDYLHTHRVHPRIAVQANSIQALIEIVQRTDLFTLLLTAVAADHPGLTALAVDPPPPARRVALLRRADGYESAGSAALTRVLTTLIR